MRPTVGANEPKPTRVVVEYCAALMICFLLELMDATYRKVANMVSRLC